MKVFNLTDVETRQLRHQGLVGCSIKDLFGVVVRPGACVECRDTTANRKHLQQNYVVRGALAIDKPPVSYTGSAGKESSKPPSLPRPTISPLSPLPVEEPEEDSPDTHPSPGSGAEVEEKPKRKKRSSKRSS